VVQDLDEEAGEMIKMHKKMAERLLQHECMEMPVYDLERALTEFTDIFAPYIENLDVNLSKQMMDTLMTESVKMKKYNKRREGSENKENKLKEGVVMQEYILAKSLGGDRTFVEGVISNFKKYLKSEKTSNNKSF